ncbi:LysR family transcriptional regulator [Methylotenera sp.]|uniref:LysR family transcriptional regulator n=1 Tax=Methylotenera sp. TaxID=2051956 RepID=UPI00248956E3|nr:LysR family transcriptional regulator [Methylotenera sp.]MDI1299584.1 LysR family transcriptional regulator [Methylotenera sp.]
MLNAYNKASGSLGDLGNLRRLVYFVAVVETGSFTAAADRLGITKAVVSQQVARLEQEFRTSLLIRTTRKVQATEAGLAFYQRCMLILRDAETAFDELSDGVAEPSGVLRLTAPFDYGINIIVPAIVAYTRRYPDCKVDAVFSDKTLDMMSSEFELAIRVGWLTQTGLQGRKIGSFRQLLVASPSMQSQIEQLSDPEDLTKLPFIANSALREPLRWNFSLNDIEHKNVSMQTSIFLDATLAVREAVLKGAGLAVFPDYAIADDLKSGRLMHVLPQWSLPTGGIHAVFPSARFRPAKVRAFVDLLVNNKHQ